MASVFLDVVIDPADENFFVAQFLHGVVCLFGEFEEYYLWVSFERDFGGDIDLSVWESTLMICQMMPRMMCYRFYITSAGVMFTTVQPIARADSIAKFKFSIFW